MPENVFLQTKLYVGILTGVSKSFREIAEILKALEFFSDENILRGVNNASFIPKDGFSAVLPIRIMNLWFASYGKLAGPACAIDCPQNPLWDM